MSIIITTIVLNICQDYFSPMAEEWWSALLWVVSVPRSPRFSCHHLCCYEGSASVHPLNMVFVSNLSVCLCQWMSEVSQDCSSLIGAGSFSEAGLGLRDVDFDAVSAFCGGVLSYWCCALCRHQPFPGFLPLLVHGRVHAPVLPRWQLGLRLLLWHRWWKLLVFVLRISYQEEKQIKYCVVLAENTPSSGVICKTLSIYQVSVKLKWRKNLNAPRHFHRLENNEDDLP